jgi:glycosyltransferase involved in cell wall biosynthesis
MAVPLSNNGFEVHYLLIEKDYKSGITKEGIQYEILKIKTFSKNRFLNFLLKRLNPNNNYKKLLKLATGLNADIYHFHDLWINRIGKELKMLDQKPVVFYDAREPYAEDYISYIKTNRVFKNGLKLFAHIVDTWEKNKSKHYDLIISNEEIVRDKFRKKLGNKKAEVLFNFTDIYNRYNNTAQADKIYDLIYCGGITELRGAFKILEATKIAKKRISNIKVLLIGRYSPENLKADLQNYIDNNGLERNVELHSEVNYSEVSEFYNKSKIGIVTLLRSRTFEISMPIKIFEYMAFGLPIIGSDFGHIKKYIERDNCGLVVDPSSSDKIALAMIELLTDQKKYQMFSNNGRKATLKKYKWEKEFKKLLQYYSNALDERDKDK